MNFTTGKPTVGKPTLCNPTVPRRISVKACLLIGIAIFLHSGCTDQTQQADQLVRVATRHSEAGHHSDAVRLADRAIALNPGSAEAFYLRGSCLSEMQQPQKAVEDLSTATRLKPDWDEAWCALGIAQLTSGETELGVASLTKALQLNSKMQPAWEARARGYRGLHRTEYELLDIEALLQLDATHCEALLRRGTLLSETNPSQAIEDLSHVIRSDRNNATAWKQRGLCFNHTGDTERALADLNVACRLSPNDSQSWLERGRILRSLERFDDAIRDLSKANELAPDNFITRLEPGRTHLGNANLAAASANLLEAERLSPHAGAQSFLDRQRLQLEGGESFAASQDLSKYLEVYPDDIEALTLRARAFLAQNETENAITDLTLAILKKPGADLYTLRAAAFAQFDESATALTDIHKAIALQPDSPQLHQKLAELLIQNRQFRNAVQALDSLAASGAGPLSVEQQLLRGRAQLADGNLDGAHEDACALAAETSASPGSENSDDIYLLQSMIALQRRDDVEALRLMRYVAEDALTAEELLLYGQALSRQSQPDEAIRVISSVLASDPSNTSALLARATVFHETADWQAASDDASAVLQSTPDDPVALQIKGKSLFQNDQFREALATLEHPALLSCDTNDVRWLRIQCCNKLRLTSRELEELNALLENVPTHEEARLLRSKLLEKLGRFDDAVADVTAVLQQNPANLTATTDRALLNHRNGNAAAEVADLTRAIELSPADADLYYRCGIARNHVGQRDLARQDLDKAIELNPELAEAWYVIGNIEAGRGQTEAALAAYARTVEIKPEHAQAWYNRGNLMFNQSMLHQAVDCWAIAISIQPEFFRAYNNRAAAYDLLDQDTAAVADYEKTLQLNPGFVRAWDNLAWLLITSDNKEVRDPKRAVKLATQACELSEFKDWTCLKTLATCCAENQEFDAALKWASQARSVAPEADRKDLDQLVAAYEARSKSNRISGKPRRSVRR